MAPASAPPAAMIAPLFAALLALLSLAGAAPRDAVPAAPPASATAVANDKLFKCLEAWLKAYRSGKVPFHDRRDMFKDSIANRFGVLPKGLVGAMTWQRELDLLLEMAVEVDTPEAADYLLEFAAVGLDEAKYTREMAPHLVRDTGEKWVARLKGAAAREQVLKAARGETKVDRSRAVAIRAAALRALGVIAEPAFRATLEQELGHAEMHIRLAAAEGLQRLGNEASAEALARQLEKEDQDNVIVATVAALRASYARYLKSQQGGPEGETKLPESSRLAVRAAIQALGRTTWRADMELVSFLDDFRSPETVPALIAILERFKTNQADVLSGKTSTLLLHRAHETLVGMTGAVFAADQPEQWRELWEREKDKLQIARKKDATAAPGTVAKGLFGIPVQGSRVTFIVDLSGSMDFAMPSAIPPGEVPDRVPTRMDVAKKQLHQVINDMPEVSSFNCVTFNGLPKAKVWNKELQQATPRNKDKFHAFIEDMRPDGGTNLWSGLEEALKMKSLVYGNRYETNLDEIFVISDGAPNLGDVVDPVEILRLVTETNRFSKVRINTVFITSPNAQNPKDTTMTPEELMKRMAEQNGGRYVRL